MTCQIVYQGRKFQVAVEGLVLPDGRILNREVVVHPGAVAVLPVVDAEHLCLLRNRRPAVGEVLWEIPAGTLEPGEVPDQAAVRELAEETGYQAAQWHKVREFYPSPGVLSERMYLYVAWQLTPGTLHLEPEEEIVPQVVGWEQALGWALDGTIRDAKTLVALLLWERLRQEIQV